MKTVNRIAWCFVICSVCLFACTTVDLYEKTVAIPGHEWKSSYRPRFTFDIKDSSASYQLFFVIRHTEKYSFNNIYINVHAVLPGRDSLSIRKDLTLATNEHGWLATGMDDVYEHRIKLGEPEKLKAGTYTFSIEQIMREDPLQHVMNAGLRIEKKP